MRESPKDVKDLNITERDDAPSSGDKCNFHDKETKKKKGENKTLTVNRYYRPSSQVAGIR